MMEAAPRVQLSSADGDCTLGVGRAELATTSHDIVEGTVAGPITITGLLALGLVRACSRALPLS